MVDDDRSGVGARRVAGPDDYGARGLVALFLAMILALVVGRVPALAQTTIRAPVGGAYCQLLMKEAAAALAAGDSTAAAADGEALKQYRCTAADTLRPPAPVGPPATPEEISFGLISDQLPTSGPGPRLCLTVEADKPLTAPISWIGGGSPKSVTFYPVVADSCSVAPTLIRPTGRPALDIAPTVWTVTDTRELRTTVHGAPMCLSARYGGAFNTALSTAYLNAFRATAPGSPFAYLANDVMNGAPPAIAQTMPAFASPELVVSPCGRSDGVDFWTYDDLSGTISGPNGGLVIGGLGSRKCVAIDGAPGNAGTGARSYQSGMPVYAANCEDVTAYTRDPSLAAEHWTATTGVDRLPTYRPPGTGGYYTGAAGLPITGPLGRCLTRDNVAPGAVVTSDCDGRVEQQWKVSGSAIRLGDDGGCLTASGGGGVVVDACVAGATNQQWTDAEPPGPAIYALPFAAPATAWTTNRAYGQIRPAGAPGQCLAVQTDPFADPMMQRNPVVLTDCSAQPPRQASWFRPTRVRTVRLGLLRYSDDAQGDNIAMGAGVADQCAAGQICLSTIAQRLAALLSENYQSLGVRFVFDPAHDIKDVANPVANAYATTKVVDGQTVADYAAADIVSGDASHRLYGKIAIAIVNGYQGGEFSSGDFVEYDPLLIFDPITGPGAFPVTSGELLGDYLNDTTIPRDPAGLPALSSFALTGSLSGSLVNVTPHEIGHYLSLRHTFGPDEFLDTPGDTGDGSGWTQGSAGGPGGSTCGNPRTAPTIAFGPASVTPDRNDIQSYWGCMVGRAHTSLSPFQLARARWVLNNQLNRYPLVACQPVGDYDADHLRCENAASLAQCQETAAYLAANTGESMTCQGGGVYAELIATLLEDPRVQALLAQPSGRALISQLAGRGGEGPSWTPEAYAAAKANVQASLVACVNLPLTMAIANRLENFVQSGAGATAQVAAQTFNSRFIGHVPRLLN